jgi:BlaI family transcriptional regulator, penicillinase repressor
MARPPFHAPTLDALSRRERQIMEVVYRRGSATVGDVLGDLPDPPSYSAVRATLRLLEERGHLTHVQDGARYLYRPVVRRDAARRTALANLLDTFFDNSAEEAVATLLELRSTELGEGELERLGELIERARREGR